MSPQIKKIKIEKKFMDTAACMQRWLLCQNIGKVFYHSEIPYERLEQIKEYFERSDALKEELFVPKLK